MVLLEKVRDFLLKVIEKTLIPLVALVFILIFLQVLFRYVFNFSLFWIQETVLFLMAYVAFLAAANGIHEDSHPKMRFLLAILPEKIRLFLHLIINLLIIWFALVFAVEGYKLAIFSIPIKTSGLGISLFWPYLAMPLGGGLMSIIAIIDTIMMIVKREIPFATQELE